jgi:MYXO-CTERM domain-containing protein
MRNVVLSLSLLFGTITAVQPRVADACGGCFAPPGSAQVVTDHRMVLSMSTTRTVLWDQFQYAGRPEEFSWILPIRYTDRTQVQLASDDFMTLMTNLTVPALQAPAPPPFPPGCQSPFMSFDAAAGGFLDASLPPPADSSVSVLREEVVGPYAVAVLRGTDAMVLRRWLTDNRYVVPAGLEPTLQHYIDLNMDFVALRLRPGEGLNRMVPVRVSVEGYQPRLPLRMIAAGIADKVGLSLVVFNESRVEATNFPNGQYRDEDFSWDWNTPPSNLGQLIVDRFEAINRANAGRAWVTESALTLSSAQVVSQARFFPQRMGFGGPDGGMMSSARPEEDAALAFQGIGASATVTRLRADLEGRMLDRDLDLGASTAGGRERFYRFGSERNRPMYSVCPWPITDAGGPVLAADAPAGSVDGAVVQASDAAGAGGDGAAANPATAGGGVRCATRAPGSETRGAWLALGLAALAVARRRRR